MSTVYLLIKGKVQGVFYRAKAKDRADELGLTGWIKNREDGKVEALVSGDEKSVQLFLEWCKLGPSRAHVESVEVEYRTSESFPNFKIMR